MKNKSLNIVKAVVMVLLCLNFFSCSEESKSEVCRTESFQTFNIVYDEFLPTLYSFNASFDGKIRLEYDDLGRIDKVVGGLQYLPYPSSLSPFSMSNSVEEDVVYEGNKIIVDSERMYVKEFEIQNDLIVSQKTTYAQSLNFFLLADHCTQLLSYEYQNNVILEKENGLTRRIFHFENGNLTTVEFFLRNFNAENLGKLIYTFSEYDAKPNLLKGKFFIHGNFLKAFSNNNYKRYTVHRYDYVDGEYVITGPGQGEIYSYSIQNLPNDLFVENCQ